MSFVIRMLSKVADSVLLMQIKHLEQQVKNLKRELEDREHELSVRQHSIECLNHQIELKDLAHATNLKLLDRMCQVHGFKASQGV